MTKEEFEQQVREEHQKWLSEGNLQALEEVFPVGQADDPIPLFEGTSLALIGDGEKPGELRIELTWSPRPRVCFTLTGVDIRDGSEPKPPIPAMLFQSSRDHLNAFSEIRIPNLAEPIAVRIESYSIDSPETATFAGVVIENVTSA